jgi:succinate dehydrogenase/fumarate reductase cytochrome b subunit
MEHIAKSLFVVAFALAVASVVHGFLGLASRDIGGEAKRMFRRSYILFICSAVIYTIIPLISN